MVSAYISHGFLTDPYLYFRSLLNTHPYSHLPLGRSIRYLKLSIPKVKLIPLLPGLVLPLQFLTAENRTIFTERFLSPPNAVYVMVGSVVVII
jgi:hypothetical protein